jgi:hypothetical protein
MLRHFCVVLLLATPATAVFAHDELPTAQWCAGGDPQEVATFSFSGHALTAAPMAKAGAPGPIICADQPSGGKNAAQAKNCGQFDDDYTRGSDAGNGFCGNFKRPRKRGEIADAGSVVTLVEAPASFLSTTHHADYSLSQGLSGVCVRCESIPPAPPPSSSAAVQNGGR